MVGKTGFEPATSWSQTKRSTKLSYFPRFLRDGAPIRSRTRSLLIRSQTLYPIELWARVQWRSRRESGGLNPPAYGSPIFKADIYSIKSFRKMQGIFLENQLVEAPKSNRKTVGEVLFQTGDQGRNREMGFSERIIEIPFVLRSIILSLEKGPLSSENDHNPEAGSDCTLFRYIR